MYLTFKEYTQKGGKVTDETAFNRLEYQAAKKVDKYTQGRVKAQRELSEEVKNVMVEIVDCINSFTPEAGGSISAVSNDGVSVSYADPQKAEQTLEAKIKTLCFDFLGALCWRGVER